MKEQIHDGGWQVGFGRLTFPHTQMSSTKTDEILSEIHPEEFSRNMMRMEHRRVTGPLAHYPGEERLLLFRPDVPGPIAKIVYSLSYQPDTAIKTENICITAKVHVIDVKEKYRGYDLGGYLFRAAISRLKQSIAEYLAESSNSGSVIDRPCTVPCHLEAEEDSRRHNKLIHFYQRLGCRLKPNARVQFVNHNDSEMYRKVPMMIDIDCSLEKSDRGILWNDLLKGFIPLIFKESSGKTVNFLSSSTKRYQFLLCKTKGGKFVINTTDGFFLYLRQENRVLLHENYSTEERDCNFVLLPVIPPNGTRKDWSMVEGTDSEKHFDLLESGMVIRSLSGSYLAFDSQEGTLVSSITPYLWHSQLSSFSLYAFEDDSLSLFEHENMVYGQKAIDTTIHMRHEILHGDNKLQLSILEVLDAASEVPGYAFTPNTRVSLRLGCFVTAESFRINGYPDWIQLIGLLYNLGDFLHSLKERDPLKYVGSFHSHREVMESYVISSSYLEPSHLSKGIKGQPSGFDRILLSWSGPEYMYWTMKMQLTHLPLEAMRILRLASLVQWHSGKLYADLASKEEEEIRGFAADFHGALRSIRERPFCFDELEVIDCDSLWSNHYSAIAEKYGLDGKLWW